MNGTIVAADAIDLLRAIRILLSLAIMENISLKDILIYGKMTMGI